ncbi:MAG TPA: lytic transglycosylase domain-containing protein [Bacteroidales bacterium]|nr:lytic transglycosylase domain-containing protein [Bacteroidales bacterium]
MYHINIHYKQHKHYLVLFLSFFLLFYFIHDFYISLPVPVDLSGGGQTEKIEKILVAAGAPKDRIPVLRDAVATASGHTGFSPALIVALMKTESTFKKNAISPLGYKGEMQTPFATRFSEVNVLYGVKILQEKLLYADGDILLALALYKGGNNSMAKRQAKETYKLYKQLAKLS